jgi:hypothetical protein
MALERDLIQRALRDFEGPVPRLAALRIFGSVLAARKESGGESIIARDALNDVPLQVTRGLATNHSHRERVQSGGGLIFESPHGAPGLKGWFREDMRLPYCTTMAGAQAAVEGIRALKT